MEIIWRMEHINTGEGPFQHSSRLFSNKRHNIHTDKYPTLWRDVPIRQTDSNSKYYAACPSWKTFLKWFNPLEIRYLKENGFTIRKLKVRKIIMGKSGIQCLFRREDIIS